MSLGEREKKSVIISIGVLPGFVSNAKATIGAFAVQMSEDDLLCYFFFS